MDSALASDSRAARSTSLHSSSSAASCDSLTVLAFFFLFDGVVELLGLGVQGGGLVAVGAGFFQGLLQARGKVDGPASRAVGPLRQEFEEIVKVGLGERRLLANLYVGEVVIPYPLGLLAFGEENEVGFDARASGREDTAGQTDDAVNAALLKELALGLDKGDFVGAEQDAFVQDDAALAVRSSCS